MNIRSDFDSGNGIFKGVSAQGELLVEIKIDRQSEFFQWYHFIVEGEKGEDCVIRITNAGKSSYPGGWESYSSRCSADGITWTTAETSYENNELIIRTKLESERVRFAYFAPFTMKRHRNLIDEACQMGAQLSVPGKSIDGHPLELLSFGKGEKPIWVIARQHPGETMAEWWMEGFLRRILDSKDLKSINLLEKAQFHVVPNMNPDGSRRGHLRTNANGANLNREWLNPSMENSPEVFHVRELMHKTGVAFCLDVHGDEGLPYNFLDGPLGIASLTEAQKNLFVDFTDAYIRHNSDMQKEYGYPEEEPGTADMRICTNYVADAFNCLAVTLEQPFKDNANAPDARHGWSPSKCAALGASAVDAIADIVDRLGKL